MKLAIDRGWLEMHPQHIHNVSTGLTPEMRGIRMGLLRTHSQAQKNRWRDRRGSSSEPSSADL
jgi:hypothetical protein